MVIFMALLAHLVNHGVVVGYVLVNVGHKLITLHTPDQAAHVNCPDMSGQTRGSQLGVTDDARGQVFLVNQGHVVVQPGHRHAT